MSTLLELAASDDRIELVVGDLGFGVVEEFVEDFPERFTNVGVAEQNMTGIATGLALTGSIVFTYSIANFPTLRCLEQLRNDAAYHSANVKVVAVGGGLAYGQLGFSHHATEDLAILRVIPNMVVAAAGDPHEAAAITREICRLDGPAYMRLGKSGEPVVHAGPPSLPPGSSVAMTSEGDVALLVIGGMLPTAMEVSEELGAHGIRVGVVSMPWLRPLDEATVRGLGRRCRLVVTLEEHSIMGGLGGAVAELLAEEAESAPLMRLGLPSMFSPVVGDQAYLRSHAGLDVRSIVERIRIRTRSLRSHGGGFQYASAGHVSDQSALRSGSE